MWSTLTVLDTADMITNVSGRCVIGNASTGELFMLDPVAPMATLLGAGWNGLQTIAGLPDRGVLLVVDGGSLLWQVDLTTAVPASSRVVSRALGSATQLVVPTPQTAFLLGRASLRRPQPLRSVALRGPTPARLPMAPSWPWPWLERARILRIDLASGATATVSAGHVDAAGLAVTSDERVAYVTGASAGELVAVDLGSGTRIVVTGGLASPGACSWLDEARGLLLVIETGGVAIVDVASGETRHLPGAAGVTRSAVRVDDQIVLAATTTVHVVNVAAVTSKKVLLGTPAAPIYRGGYARVQVDLGSSGLTFDDLEFDVVEGPQFAGVSPSRDDLFDPAHPQIMLLAGPMPGTFTLRTRTTAGVDVATAAFGITDTWAGPDGPPRAFTGANPLYASGGTWGALSNGVFPFNFTYGPDAVIGIRRVALIFVQTSDTTLPAGTAAMYRNALFGGVVAADGVTRSVAAYFNELSDGRLTFMAAGEATVTLSRTWQEYTKVVSPTDLRFWAQDALIADAMWAAQNDLAFRDADTAVFVVASPNGGQILPGDPVPANRFTWPIASGGTYMLYGSRPGVVNLWWWKSLPWTVMPAEWELLDTRRVFETLSHEIGHTIGLGDLYGDSRELGGYDLMSSDGGLPALSIPHQVMLGWVNPAHLRTFNFLLENPVDETLTLTAAERLGAGDPPPNERAGAVVEVAEGWRYYFEYRSRQNATATDPGPTQVADQSLPEDRQILGLDVKAGWYSPPVSRRPIRLLADDGDNDGPALAVGQDYVEPDVTGNATFRLEVLSADDDRATIRVRYQPVAAPEPPWPNGPDPSIRPWPGGTNWTSPDIRVENASGQIFPWAGHDNTVIATVRNGGTVAATDVKVGFWVKDFSVSSSGPETLLGWDVGDVPAGGSTEFRARWTPPAMVGAGGGPLGLAHYCIVVRIASHTQGNPPRGEVNPDNNVAQSNYAVLWTLEGSPFSRARLPVQVSNPYTDRPANVQIHVEQKLDYYRTYVDPPAMRLAPGETRQVEVMVECLAGEAPYNDLVPRATLFREPNIVTAIAVMQDPDSDVSQPIGGATIEVRAARRTVLTGLDVNRTGTVGGVELTDGSPVTRGEVLIASHPGQSGREVAYRARVDLQGRFELRTPDFGALPAPLIVDLVYLGAQELGPSSTRLTLT